MSLQAGLQGTLCSCGELLYPCWFVTWNLYPTESGCVAIISLTWDYWLYYNVHFVLCTARVLIRLLFMLPLGKVIYVGLFPASMPIGKQNVLSLIIYWIILMQNKLLAQIKRSFKRMSCPFYLPNLCWCIVFRLRKHQTEKVSPMVSYAKLVLLINSLI